MDTIHPDEAKKKAVRKGVAAATLFGIGMVALSAVTFMEYGLVLFLCTPFLVGAVAPLVAGFSARITTADWKERPGTTRSCAPASTGICGPTGSSTRFTVVC